MVIRACLAYGQHALYLRQVLSGVAGPAVSTTLPSRSAFGTRPADAYE